MSVSTSPVADCPAVSFKSVELADNLPLLPQLLYPNTICKIPGFLGTYSCDFYFLKAYRLLWVSLTFNFGGLKINIKMLFTDLGVVALL